MPPSLSVVMVTCPPVGHQNSPPRWTRLQSSHPGAGFSSLSSAALCAIVLFRKISPFSCKWLREQGLLTQELANTVMVLGMSAMHCSSSSCRFGEASGGVVKRSCAVHGARDLSCLWEHVWPDRGEGKGPWDLYDSCRYDRSLGYFDCVNVHGGGQGLRVIRSWRLPSRMFSGNPGLDMPQHPERLLGASGKQESIP